MKQLQECADFINTTTSPRTFWGRLNLALDILLELQKFEKYGLFRESIPTKDYNKIIGNLEATVNEFIDRVIITQSEKNELLSSQNEKDKKMKKCVENLWHSFYEANDYWRGNNMYPHYSGKLYVDSNLERVEDILQDLTMKEIQNSESTSNSSATSGKSQYSEFPRYYNIDGIKYDIDNPKSIERIPLVSNIFYINGKTYGMDTILYEHYRQCPDRSIGYTAFDKCEELRKHGIIHKSDWELELESRWQARKEKEDSRKQQSDTFTVDDMQQFPDIPIAWSYIMQLQHTNGIAWCQLNWNNQQVVLQYISQINDIIVDAQSYVDGIGNAHIDLYSMDFNYPVHMYMDSMCNTRIECYPYTATGKLSKYPVVIQFATKKDINGLRSVGEIKILRDGNIGTATVSINGNTFKIGLHGTSLVLKRVDNPYLGGNLFKFSETYD